MGFSSGDEKRLLCVAVSLRSTLTRCARSSLGRRFAPPSMCFFILVTSAGGFVLKTLAIPYYWSCYSRYWCVRRDMIGLEGNDIAFRIEKSLEALKRDGVDATPPPPAESNPVWLFGLQYASAVDPLDVPELVLLPENVRLAAFAFVLSLIKEIAIQYGFCTFIDAEGFTPNADRLSETRVEPAKSLFYRHPVEGHIKIDTFARAMEIYGYMLAAGEPQGKLERWFEMAMELKGAPDW